MSNDRLDELDYYTLIGVPDDASTDAIRAAFRSFARRYHPDRFAGEDETKKARATRIFRRGSEAFQVLTDDGQRRAYDEALARGKLRLTEGGVSSEPRSSGREPGRAPNASPASPASPAPSEAQAPASPIRTPEAQAHFKRAVEAAKSQDWPTAWNALRAANQLEPGNPFLEKRFDQVDAMVRSRSGRS